MFVTKMAIDRRTVLRGLGATVALPWLDAMAPALEAAPPPTKRFGAIYVPNGIVMENWTPAAEGTNFAFPADSAAVGAVSGSSGRADRPQ